MQFYEPGPYEEFVGKISAAKVKPSASAWHNISQALDELQRKKRQRFLYLLTAYAATLVLAGGITLFFLYNTTSKYIENSQVTEIPLLKADNSLPPIVTVSYLNSPSALPSSSVKVDKYVEPRIVLEPTNEQLSRLEAIEYRSQSQFLPEYKLEKLAKSKLFGEVVSTTKSVKSNILPTGNSGWVFALYTNPYFSSNTSNIASQLGVTKEMGLWMWGGEVQLKKRISEKVGLVFGLAVNPTGQKTTDLLMHNEGSITRDKNLLSATTSYGIVAVASPRNEKSVQASGNGAKSLPVSLSELSQYIYHVEVPVMLSTSFKVDRVGVEFRFGGSAGMLIHNKFEVQNEFGEFAGETQGVKPYSVAAIGAVSVSIPIANKLSLVVEPYFRLGLVSLYNQPSSTAYPFNASLRFGLGYSF